MLLPCPSCKKPVFVSGSVLSSGPADVQCSSCTALLKIHPDGATELVEGHATATGEAPELELPEAEAPVPGRLDSPTSSGTVDLDETNSQWHEPAARDTPTASALSAPDPSDPSVSEPALAEPRELPPSIAPAAELQEPPADWPLSPSAMEGADETASLTHPEILPEPPSSGPPPIPGPAPMGLELSETPVRPPPIPAESQAAEEPAPAVLGNLDPRKPAARLRGTEIVEVNAAPDASSDPVEDDSALARFKALLGSVRPPQSDTLANLIPEAALSTVQTSEPRLATEGTGPSDDEVATAEISGPGLPPGQPVHDPSASAGSHYPEPPLIGAQATPAFSAPPQAPKAGASSESEAAHAVPMAQESEAERAEDVDEIEALPSAGAPWKPVGIAAALIAIVGAAVYFSGGASSGELEGAVLATRSAEPETESSPEEPASGGDPDAATSELEVARQDDSLDEPIEDEARIEPEALEGRRVSRSERGAAKPREPRTVANRASARKPTRAASKPIASPPPPPPTVSRARSNSTQDSARADQLYSRANQFLAQEKVTLAIDALETAIELNPRHGGAYRSLGVSYMKLGQRRSAIRAYKKFVELAPTHRDADAVRQIIANYSAP